MTLPKLFQAIATETSTDGCTAVFLLSTIQKSELNDAT